MARRRLEIHWFVDHIAEVGRRSNLSIAQARELVLQSIEQHRPWNDGLLVAVMAIGFATDSYILFTSNAILPMLGYVYWHSATTSTHEVAFNIATLSGCIFGMILFGCLADTFGRRKMYGLTLLVLIIGTFGVVTSSVGFTPIRHDFPGDYETTDWKTRGSMNIFSWLLWWRFVSGVGLGGDYPLTGAMVAELAPTVKRGYLLASVFYAQAVGVALAAIVSLIVVAGARAHDPDPSPRTIDQVWRWVMGFSLVLAAFAMALRLNIPESPRFTMDVRHDLWRAFRDTNTFRNTNMEGQYNAQDDFEMIRRQVRIDRNRSEPRGNTIEEQGSHLDPPPRRLSWKEYFHDLHVYFWRQRNIWSLLGTSLAWLMLDIAFYALSLSSPQTVAKLWYQAPSNGKIAVWDTAFDVINPNRRIYDILVANNWHSLVVTSTGALIGGACMTLITRTWNPNRKKFQTWSFAVLGALFLITGPVYWKYALSPNHSVIIPLYCLCEFVFYLGPNTLTFVLPAELFPTCYRGMSLGVSAAFGKLGSLIIELILAYLKINHKLSGAIDSVGDPESNWLGWVITLFSIAMFAGSFITHKLIPNVQNPQNRNYTLEDLENIRAREKAAAAAIDAEDNTPPPTYNPPSRIENNQPQAPAAESSNPRRRETRATQGDDAEPNNPNLGDATTAPA